MGLLSVTLSQNLIFWNMVGIQLNDWSYLHEGEGGHPVALALAVAGVGGDQVASVTRPIVQIDILIK